VWWFPSIRRIVLLIASYVVAVVLRDVPDRDAIGVYVVAGIVVLFISATDEYYTTVRPTKRIAELAPIALDGLAEPLLAQLKKANIVVRINLMMPKRVARWCWMRRDFKMIWSKGMENQPDVNISFPIKCGITGACLRTKKPIYASPDDLGKPNFALPKRVASNAPDLQVIFSYPVYESARKGHPQSGNIIGVLNLDSTAPDAYNLLMTDEVFDQVDQTMQNVATLAARFYE
jgi:hypothetical protein